MLSTKRQYGTTTDTVLRREGKGKTHTDQVWRAPEDTAPGNTPQSYAKLMGFGNMLECFAKVVLTNELQHHSAVRINFKCHG